MTTARDTAPVQRRPSMDDVARAAGVSKGAVSKVIRNAYGVSPQMRAKVEQTIAEMGYRPRIAARSMRGQSFTIGVEIPNLGNEFFTQIIQGAATRLAGSDYGLIMAPGLGDSRGDRVLESLMDRQVDGVIAISPGVTQEWLERAATEVPFVLLGRHDDSDHYDTVMNDDEAGARLAVAHLRELGHERIAHLTLQSFDAPAEERTPHAIRATQYRAEMSAAHLEPVIATCTFTEGSAYEATRQLLRNDPSITALFAGNDTLAIEAMRAAMDARPGGPPLSIVGYDDIPLASHPLISLTTVAQFGHVMGRVTIDRLMERIVDGRTEAKHERINPSLKIRSSTHPA